jgi:hypothetical protein
MVRNYYKNWTDYFGTKYWMLPTMPMDATCDGYVWHFYSSNTNNA